MLEAHDSDSEEDESSALTARSTSRSKNGKHLVNMTPPEDMLASVSRRARKFAKIGKVTYTKSNS